MSRRWRRLCWFVLGCIGTALFIAVLYALLQGAQTTQAIRDTQVDNHTLLNTINDCTQTGGKCHARGLKQTAAAVASISQRGAAYAACQIVLSKQSPDATAQELYTQINQCADETLAVLKHQHGSSR